MAFGNNNFDSYEVHQQFEALKVIPNLDEQSIRDITLQDIQQRYDFNIILPMNNLPYLIDQTFKQTKELYPESIQELDDEENRLLGIILTTIEYNCGVKIEIPDDANLYSYTYYIYDFLISGFKQHMIEFFTNYIIREKNTIYQEMNLSIHKKDKNSSSKYGKLLYSNPKLAAISTYLNEVVTNMCSFDISLETILSNIYQNQSISTTLLSSIFPVQDFFKTQYVVLVTNPYISQSIISNIRLAIHNIAIN